MSNRNIPESQRHTIALKLRLSKDSARLMKLRAESLGQTVSAYVNSCHDLADQAAMDGLVFQADRIGLKDAEVTVLLDVARGRKFVKNGPGPWHVIARELFDRGLIAKSKTVKGGWIVRLNKEVEIPTDGVAEPG